MVIPQLGQRKPLSVRNAQGPNPSCRCVPYPDGSGSRERATPNETSKLAPIAVSKNRCWRPNRLEQTTFPASIVEKSAEDRGITPRWQDQTQSGSGQPRSTVLRTMPDTAIKATPGAHPRRTFTQSTTMAKRPDVDFAAWPCSRAPQLATRVGCQTQEPRVLATAKRVHDRRLLSTRWGDNGNNDVPPS